MSRWVEFDEQRGTPFRRGKKLHRPLMVRWMMKLPFIRTEAQANLGLVFIILAALLASYLVLNGTFNFTSQEQTYIEDLTPEQRQELPQELLDALPSRADR